MFVKCLCLTLSLISWAVTVQACIKQIAQILSRGHATLELAVSVHRSVGHVFDSQVVSTSPLLPNCPRLDCRVSGLVYIHFANYHQRQRKIKKENREKR